MKLYDLCKLCESVARLNKLRLSFHNSSSVRDLYKKLQYDVEFYCQEEEKVICSFISAGNARREGSKLIFDQLPEKKDNQQMMRKYIEKIDALNKLEVDVPFDGLITISTDEIGVQKISGDDIERLSSFVVFGDG